MARVTANDDLLGDSDMQHDGAMGNRTHLQAALEHRNREMEDEEDKKRQKRQRENQVRRSQGLPPLGDDPDEEINVGGITMRLARGHHTNGNREK
jgi:hypothetical protein